MKSNIFIKFIMVAWIMLFGLSCDPQSFRDLDDPKYRLTQEKADMSTLFTSVVRDYGRGYAGANPIRKEGGYLKYYSTYSNLFTVSAYNQFDQSINDSPWSYTGVVIEAITMENYLEKLEDPLMDCNLAMTRVLKVAIFQRLTDFFGDIPCSEAGLLAIKGMEFSKPKYDKQADIYDWMLKTLEAEAPKLDPNSAAAARRWSKQDVSVYGGDIAKWRKFAYSLMLRLAMRISDVDATKAKRYAELAIASGVITTNADNFAMRCGANQQPNDERNNYSNWFAGEGGGDPERYVKLGLYFVNHLKTNNDPRRKIIFGGRLNSDISAITASNMSTYWRDATKWDWDLDKALGVPHGINANPSASIAAYHQTYTSPNPFLWINTRNYDLLTASEVLLLISEANLKGWNTGTYTAQSAYEAGVKANMSLLAAYTGLLAHQTISNDEMNAYLAEHPLGTGASAKTRIAEEMWLTMYMNPLEGWFNVRRMGLNLPPNQEGIRMPRRNAYVNNERSNNLDNLNAALQSQGMNTGITREEEVQQRVWWDVANKQ